MIQKTKKDKIWFWVYNIFFSTFGSLGICSLLSLIISLCISSCFKNYVDKSIDIYIVSFILSFFVLFLSYIVLKFISLPLIYKFSKNDYFKFVLDKFVSSNNYKKISIIVKIILFDIAVYIITAFLSGFFLYIFMFENDPLSDNIFLAFILGLLTMIFTLGGVLGSYISFLIWHKIKYRNEQKEIQEENITNKLNNEN